MQHQAARFVINNFDRMASVTEMLQNVKWDTLATRRLSIQCSMFYKMKIKVKHGLVGIPFPSCVTPCTRTKSSNFNTCCYQPIQTRVDAYKYSFFVCAIPVWNRLPTSVVTAPSIHQFQSLALPFLRDLQATSTHLKL